MDEKRDLFEDFEEGGSYYTPGPVVLIEALLWRDSTGSVLRDLVWEVVGNQDVQDFIDRIMASEYPGWEIGTMAISTIPE